MYTTGIFIHEPLGNNEFSYQERLALSSLGKIYVPSLITGTIDDLEIGSETVFEEVVNGKLISCKGLHHFLQTSYEGIPIFIVDNHNHALSFWMQYAKESSGILGQNHLTSVIHIDQHSDVKPNENKFTINDSQLTIPDIETFVNEKTNVGNFITAAINSGIIKDVIQIRSDYALRNTLNPEPGALNYILDIDIDFWADKEITPEEINIIRKLIKKAKVVTIATSPYFIDQNKAITIIKKILQQDGL